MDNKMIAAIAVVAVVVIAGGAAAITMLGNNKDDGDKITIDDLAATGNYLKIFGNANGDYLIDDKDVQIIQNYIDGKITKDDLLAVQESDDKKNYYLADANCDGKVDADDITVLKGIINRDGSYMKIIDTFGHLLTVPLKIERIACDYFATAELLNMVGVQDKIVGASHALVVLKDYYLQNADMSKVVDFNSRTGTNTDYETLAANGNPQVWVVSENYGPKHAGHTQAVVIGLDTLVFDFDNILASSPIMSALLTGYIFGAPEKGIEYVNWYLKTWNMLNDKTQNLADSDRPVCYYTGYGGKMKMDTDGTTVETTTNTLRYFPNNTVCWQAVKLAGGTNLIDSFPTKLDLPSRPTSGVNTDLEWVSTQKCDYIFVHCTKYTGSGVMQATVPTHGYLCDDSAEYRKAQNTLTNINALPDCDAKNMYLTPGDFMNGASGGLMSAIMVATVIHADLFPDLSLNKELQTFVDLMGFDYDVSKHGVFFLYNE